MKFSSIILALIFVSSIAFLPSIHAEPSVSIVMEKSTYKYCERLFYIIEVSEITGNPAIIHIRDESGKGSSAIPIEIANLQNPVPALFPFNEEQFALGKYFIDVEYADSKFTAEFELIDSENICIPESVRQFMIEWLLNDTPEKDLDGYLIDMIQKYVDPKLIDIPFEVNEENINMIKVPEWVKNISYWWIQGFITDNDFAQAVNFLIEKNHIAANNESENEI
ncbi:MAG: hypothetical protein HOK63_01715 [Thaumarchaeota archaeon]|jgi:hypothetical protein|nr:hypothetical protein [Nitrososphaerota archaeon]MBT5842104.1 hypothetical protein [Nitrososphaerota archaeon]MBT6468359.1 hypothetical protein [Nitrososphaerota archaeon]